MESPYRAAVSQAQLEARTDVGTIKLVVAPQHTRLEVGPRVWTIANDTLTVVTQTKKRPKKRSVLLRGAHLYVARAWPTNEISLWLERRAGVIQRLLGLPPIPGMSEETMETWRELDRLASRLQEALADYSEGATAFELGNGQHRVFALQTDGRLVVFARPVFREKPRRVVELQSDGTLLIPGRRGKDRSITMERGLEVIATGDRIQFCHRDGEQVAGIFLPWIGSAEREELTRRLQALVPTPSPRTKLGEGAAPSANARLSRLLPS